MINHYKAVVLPWLPLATGLTVTINHHLAILALDQGPAPSHEIHIPRHQRAVIVEARAQGDLDQ